MTIALPVSTAETIGLARPPIVVAQANPVRPELPITALAVTPPTILANALVIAGLKSATVDTITAVPAIVASGMAIASNRLSIQGMS